MAFDLRNDVRSSRMSHPPRMLIYGQRGLGKTTLASSFPAPFLINFEKGTPEGVDIPSTHKLNTYQEALDVIAALGSQDHDYKTVIFDTIDVMEPLLQQYVCEENNWPDIEHPGYGKGYTAAKAEWLRFMRWIEALNLKRNMCVVLLAHTSVGRFDDPANASYSRYEIRLNQKAADVVGDLVDGIFFLNQSIDVKEGKGFDKTKATGTGKVWAYTQPRPAWTAKNPFEMPAKVLVPKDDPYSAFADYLPAMDSPVTPIPQNDDTENEEEAA